MKKILLVTGKWPYKSEINDGGDATVSELIEALGKECLLDLLVIRDDIDTNTKIAGVHSIRMLSEDASCFDNYGKMEDSKFLKWIRIGQYVAEILRKCETSYDQIIIHHILFGTGLTPDDSSILQKTILMPMFTGMSYLQVGEYVPQVYLETERRIIPYFWHILTPSNHEKRLLTENYAASEKNIIVIPRPVKYAFAERKSVPICSMKLLYIGSVRKQKNHADAVRMMHHLTARYPDAKLFCCGALQEKTLYEECQSLIAQWNLNDNIIFLGNCSREELGQIICNCDFNISVSNGETFGRGIYEGMAAGLPTVVLKQLECVRTTDTVSVQPVKAANYQDMAEKIITLIENPADYLLESRKGIRLQEELSAEKIYAHIRQAVL